jgi:hypothetical protein
MMSRNDAGSPSREPSAPSLLKRRDRSYYAEVAVQALDAQHMMIDQIIALAFDTLGARHLDVRVYDAERRASGVRA